MKKILFALFICCAEFLSTSAQVFQKKSNCPKVGYAGVAFSIGGELYLGAGIGNKSLWKYDPMLDKWTVIGDVPGVAGERAYAVGVSIGNKAYVGLGYDGISNLKNDWWEYDVPNGSWQKKADFPGLARDAFAYFVLNGKIYLGGGADKTSSHQDFFEYNPVTDTWTNKGVLPSGAISFATCFSLDNKGYMVGGRVGGVATSQLYEYNPLTNLWSTKAAFPGSARQSAIAFVVDNEGYVGHGTDYKSLFDDIYKYNPGADTWTYVSAINKPSARCWLPSANIGNKAYMGTGCVSFSPFIFSNEFYEFSIAGANITNPSKERLELSLFPNPTGDFFQINTASKDSLKVTLQDCLGNIVLEQSVSGMELINIATLPAQLYIVRVTSDKGYSATGKLLKQ